MFSLRSKPESARIAFAATFVVATCVLLATIPALAAAEPPEGGEEPPAPQLAFEPDSYDFGLQPLNGNPSQAMLQLRNNGAVAVQVYSTEISGGNGTFWPGPSDSAESRHQMPSRSPCLRNTS